MRSNSANSSREHDNAEPSAAASRRRCRDWTGAAYRIFGIPRSRHSPDHERRSTAAAKAEVVRKSAGRKAIRVRAPVIPLEKPRRYCVFLVRKRDGSIRARPLTGCLLCRRVGAEDSLAARRVDTGADHRRSSRAQTRNRGLKRLRAIRRIRPHDATSSSRFSPRRRRPADSSAGAKRSILGVPGVRGFPRRQCLVETVDRGEID
jgi:hypothetical protein